MGNLLELTLIGDEETRDKTNVDDITDPRPDALDGAIPHDPEDTTDNLEMKLECEPPEVKIERDGHADHVDISLYEYPFENIVFGGGGAKGLAYCGVIQVLEELGIRPNITRVAGTSAGAITATLFAVGLSSSEIGELMAARMETLMLDNGCGYFSLIPNMLRYFGWNPGHRFRSWLGERFEEAGLSKTVTFKELLKKRGVELCIVVTNVNLMTTEYFHAKTTPNMQVREAVCMSIAMPLLFQAIYHDVHGTGLKDTYVDGGLFCNYPINCFDGWWLSMETEDNFIEKFGDLNDLPRMFESSSRFGVYNDRTLGFLLYADKKDDLLRDTLERTRDTGRGQIPNTKRGREFMKEMEEKDEQRKKNDDLEKALKALLKALKVHDDDQNYVFNLEELRNALEDEDLKQHKHLLFKKGAAASAEDVMEEMDIDKDGQIEFTEIVAYFGRRGYYLKTRLLGHSRRQVTSLQSFLLAIQKALSYNVQRLNVQEDDAKRTVGINTGHVGTTHFEIEAADKDYVVNQGRKATEVFLKEYVKENNPPRKKPAVNTATETKLKEDVHETTAAPNDDDIVMRTVSMPINAARKDIADDNKAGVLISNGEISHISIAVHNTEAAVVGDVVSTGRPEGSNTDIDTDIPAAASGGIDHTVEKGTESGTSSDNEAKANAETAVDEVTLSDGEKTERSGSLSDGAGSVSDGGKANRSGSLSDGDKGYQSQ